MRTFEEKKALRCSKGYFTHSDMVNAFKREGVSISRQSFMKKERGVHPFTLEEFLALAKILEIPLEEAADYLE